ncbi:Gamma-tubulin complex component 3 -like protein [Curvularia clavata]|uniref:Spindle pole body component n=1 Tax=Curvularia clavata TaxID=95742 RepID=A0A9Q8YZI5_CURCL|nr:Gamma-tubulin complex component 3 -like protein [Curvularia clavata]
MAQNARVSGLTDELIRSLLNFDPAKNKQAYKHAKEIASRNLRGQYARTNQFEVTASFAGLDEKFRIKNRDDLADALQARLKKLEGYTNKYKPEILSLLLQLADRPLENTQIEALDLLKPPSPAPPLTWAEILQDDPYSDEEIWKDIDYADDSSDDEKPLRKPKRRPSSPPTSFDEDDTYDPESCVVSTDQNLVTKLGETQFWNRTAHKGASDVCITELQAVKETLFMVQGLKTSSYEIDKQKRCYRHDSRYVLEHIRAAPIEHLLSQFAEIGSRVQRMRQWVLRQRSGKRPSPPLFQTFEAAVRKRLLQFDQSLANLQQQYLLPDAPIPVSLLQLHKDIRNLSIPILRLAPVVSQVDRDQSTLSDKPLAYINPFRHLEALFEATTLAQMALEDEVFKYMSDVFFECLQTYLKPIRRWMETGELGSDQEAFFVTAKDAKSEAASLWHDRYELRRDSQNKLQFPSFLQPAVSKVFNTGKSIVFLKELGIYDTVLHSSVSEPNLDHEMVCGESENAPLSPFPELFRMAFDSWIRSKYSIAATVLRQHIFETDDLIHVLGIFETLYLGRNGAVFEDYATAIFERMDAGRRGWNDRYVLTEVTRGIFNTVLATPETDKIVVRSTKAKEGQGKSVKDLAIISLDYAVPWSLQNIIQRTSIPIYQSLSTLLVQIYRVKYLLQKTRLHAARKPKLPPLFYKLLHSLNWFIDTLRSYVTETAIHLTTRNMVSSMQKARDIDEMAQIHVEYMAKLQQRALLSKEVKPIYASVIEVLDLGVLLARKEVKEQAHVDAEFKRLLPFITAGLKSVGRAGAEPMWEQLADRLTWDGKKDRIGQGV